MSTARSILSAMGIAAFERQADGSFSPVNSPPGWFMRIVGTGTFPFLGHILEEANQFWQRRSSGRRDWGPCAEVDESGTEFHYMVAAITVDAKQYLVFHLDPGADRMREVLQQVREQSLAASQDAARGDATIDHVQRHVQRTAHEIRSLVKALPTVSTAVSRFEAWKRVYAMCEELAGSVDRLVKAVDASARRSPPLER